MLLKRAPSPTVFADAQSSSARVATFPRIINFSKQGGRQWFFVSACVLTFLQRRIAGVWREHLLKALQKFQKIEADATLSTLCELSVLGQAILSTSLQTGNMHGHFLFVDWDLFFFFLFFTSDIHSVGLEAFGLWHRFYISTSICHHSGFKINPMNLKEMEEWAFRLKLRETFYTCRWGPRNLNAGWYEGCRQTICGCQG